MEELEARLGYVFQDKRLLETALTHSSYANEHQKGAAVCNERLEFLGDSVLGLAAARTLYLEHPEMPEGEMTRMRAELVCERSLCRAAEKLGLGQFLRLGKGETLNGGRSRPSILADATEALIAAVYLDGGWGPAATLIRDFVLAPAMERPKDLPQDYKTALQELVQQKSGQQLCYRVVGTQGPDHDKRFLVEVAVNGTACGRGQGRSKKEAEQAAAQNALEGLQA